MAMSLGQSIKFGKRKKIDAKESKKKKSLRWISWGGGMDLDIKE